jgi:hypothetical protein
LAVHLTVMAEAEEHRAAADNIDGVSRAANLNMAKDIIMR